MKKLLFIALLFLTKFGFAQDAASSPAPVNFTTEQDHQNMMDQLGIKALRPGPSGDEKAPNHANYDEALANPYPNLPDVLTLKNGKKVTTPEMWWKLRRPEIVEDLEREMYGRIPNKVPKVTWTVKYTDNEYVGFYPVIAKQMVGHVDNSGCPQIDVNINMTLVLPAHPKGKVPVLIMFGRAAVPSPSQPNPEEMEKINNALKSMLINTDPSLKAVFEQHPAYELVTAQNPFFNFGPQKGDPPTNQQLIADGWGYVMIDPASIQADNGAGLTRGIIGLTNKGQPRKPDDWGRAKSLGLGCFTGFGLFGNRTQCRCQTRRY